MKTIEELLKNLARPEVLEFGLVTNRLPSVNIGGKFEPVDDEAPSTERLIQMLVTMGGSRYVDQLSDKPVQWTTRLDGVGVIAVAAIFRKNVVQARFTVAKREAAASPRAPAVKPVTGSGASTTSSSSAASPASPGGTQRLSAFSSDRMNAVQPSTSTRASGGVKAGGQPTTNRGSEGRPSNPNPHTLTTKGASGTGPNHPRTVSTQMRAQVAIERVSSPSVAAMKAVQVPARPLTGSGSSSSTSRRPSQQLAAVAAPTPAASSSSSVASSSQADEEWDDDDEPTLQTLSPPVTTPSSFTSTPAATPSSFTSTPAATPSSFTSTPAATPSSLTTTLKGLTADPRPKPARRPEDVSKAQTASTSSSVERAAASAPDRTATEVAERAAAEKAAAERAAAEAAEKAAAAERAAAERAAAERAAAEKAAAERAAAEAAERAAAERAAAERAAAEAAEKAAAERAAAEAADKKAAERAAAEAAEKAAAERAAAEAAEKKAAERASAERAAAEAERAAAERAAAEAERAAAERDAAERAAAEQLAAEVIVAERTARERTTQGQRTTLEWATREQDSRGGDAASRLPSSPGRILTPTSVDALEIAKPAEPPNESVRLDIDLDADGAEATLSVPDAVSAIAPSSAFAATVVGLGSVPPPPSIAELPSVDPSATVDSFLAMAVAADASDLHIVAGRPILLRIATDLVPRTQELTPEHVERITKEIVPARLRETVEREGACNFAVEHPSHGRFRVHVSRQRTGFKLALRVIPREVQSIASLGLPGQLASSLEHPRGLILVTGLASQGKSTTLAALVDHINRETARHVMTVEHPIEHVHARKKGLVSQRDVGLHARSRQRTLQSSLRSDADVIMISDMRDAETVRYALVACEAGRLVLASMSAPSATKTIDRILDLFSPAEEPWVRASLASSLRLVTGQRLVPSVDRTKLHVAMEILPWSVALYTLVRDGRTHELEALAKRSPSAVRLDAELAELVHAKKITLDAAKAATEAPEELEALVQQRARSPRDSDKKEGSPA